LRGDALAVDLILIQKNIRVLKMARVERKAFYVKIILTTMIVSLILTMSIIVSLRAYFYIGLIASCALVALAKKGIFPFDRLGRIQNRLYWYAAATTSFALPMSALMNVHEFLFWYPTNNSEWAFLPFGLLGIFCWKNGLATTRSDDDK
jgi:hypothetical protein